MKRFHTILGCANDLKAKLLESGLLQEGLVYCDTNLAKLARGVSSLQCPAVIIVPGETAYEKESFRNKRTILFDALLVSGTTPKDGRDEVDLFALADRLMELFLPTAGVPNADIVINSVRWEPVSILPVESDLPADLLNLTFQAIDFRVERGD